MHLNIIHVIIFTQLMIVLICLFQGDYTCHYVTDTNCVNVFISGGITRVIMLQIIIVLICLFQGDYMCHYVTDNNCVNMFISGGLHVSLCSR